MNLRPEEISSVIKDQIKRYAANTRQMCSKLTRIYDISRRFDLCKKGAKTRKTPENREFFDKIHSDL